MSTIFINRFNHSTATPLKNSPGSKTNRLELVAHPGEANKIAIWDGTGSRPWCCSVRFLPIMVDGKKIWVNRNSFNKRLGKTIGKTIDQWAKGNTFKLLGGGAPVIAAYVPPALSKKAPTPPPRGALPPPSPAVPARLPTATSPLPVVPAKPPTTALPPATPARPPMAAQPVAAPARPPVAPAPPIPAPRGLRNLGNTCFLNASVQLLLANPIWREAIKRCPAERVEPKNRSVLEHLKKFVSAYERGASLDPVDFVQACRRAGFQRGVDQEDAPEFLTPFLAAIQEPMIENAQFLPPAGSGARPIRGPRTQIYMPTIPIPKTGRPSLQAIIDAKAAERAGDETRFKMIDGTSERLFPSKEKHTFHGTPPRTLPIQLIRNFTCRVGSRFVQQKINTPVEISHDFRVDLKELFPDAAATSTRYKITGAIIQTGNHSGGHYVSVIQNQGRWFLCDDSTVSPLTDLARARYLSQAYVFLLEQDAGISAVARA